MKRQFVGLALAVACGLVLAHVITKVGDNLYENNPAMLITIVLATILLLVAARKRCQITAWIKDRKRALVTQWTEGNWLSAITYAAGVMLLLIVAAAWLSSADPWPITDIALAFGVFALICRFLHKIFLWRKNEKWRINSRSAH